MPELPEVQTTVNGLRRRITGLKIADVWSDYDSAYFKGSDTIKDRSYFRKFRSQIIGSRVQKIERRAKNILIHIRTPAHIELIILIHMKMTGHLLYGTYHMDPKNKKDPWNPIEPKSLKDPYNRHIHFVISFDNDKHLALSDVRRFAKVTLLQAASLHKSEHIRHIGPEPLDPKFDFTLFKKRLRVRPGGLIKQVLMDQKIIAGIGNIYADESLWRANIHPRAKVENISDARLRVLFDSMITTLSRGIDFGGDSMSDYRNIDGEKGAFQEQHHAYRRTGSICDKKQCKGVITKITIGGRSTHFCNKHQHL